MIHVFDTDIAEKYGVNAAIILQNVSYWVKQNEANGTNCFDGNYWTYNSRRAYQELFPYMSKRQIETAFQKLIDDGLIITGNYNKMAYDRTLWYALTQKGKSISHFGGMDCPKKENGLHQNVQPIPDVTQFENSVVTPDMDRADKPPRAPRFTPPSLEDVKAYCQERGKGVDPERFFDYYTSNGWHVGKNKMKDWKAAARSWEKNEYGAKNKPRFVYDDTCGEDDSL